MPVELPGSVKRHAHDLAAIIILAHKGSTSQTQISEIFSAYFTEVCRGLRALGAKEDVAVELALEATSKMLDIILSRSESENPNGSRK